jgi:phage terminase small subunit
MADSKPNRPLAPMQKRFVHEYLVDLNATQACIRAGYSARNADKIGPGLLGKVRVSQAIQEAMSIRAKRTGITQDRVLSEIARLAFFDPRKLYDESGNLIPIHKLDDDTAAAIAGMDVVVTNDGESVVQIKKIKQWDKNSALEKLGKHLKLFTEKVEHTGAEGGPIEITMRAFLDRIDGTSRGLPSPDEEAACPIE